MALVPINDDDVWLNEAEIVSKLCLEIELQISERNQEAFTSTRYQQLWDTVHLRLKQLNSQLKELRKKLEVIKEDLTPDETERRLRQVELFESKQIYLQSESINLRKDNVERDLLLSPSSSAMVWQDDNIHQNIHKENLLQPQIKEKQSKMIQEQDEGLEILSKIISRQKNIATRIHEEVQIQNELLDDIGTGMENVDSRINHEINQIRQVTRKPSLCAYYLLIIFLLIILFVVLWLKI